MVVNYKKILPIFVVRPNVTIILFMVTGFKGDAGFIVVEYVPGGSPLSMKSPPVLTYEVYDKFDVAVRKANVPEGEIFPLIAPLRAVSTVLITGFSL